jgi:FixJ family two-component response regulator
MKILPHKDDPIVFVVEDDHSLRDSIAALLRAVDLKVEGFASAQEFLRRSLPDVASCLVLDVRLPGTSGLIVQEELVKAAVPIPIIFMTAHGDIPMTVRAMKAGAVEFLAKPFRDQDLLDAIHLALEKDRSRRSREQSQTALTANFARLTPREREVMGFVAAGLMNKQIAGKMGLAEITVKIHRGNVTRKMGAHNVAELVRMAQTLGISDE